MIEKCGDLFEIRRNYDAICCTTNAVVKSNGELVMGAGVAKGFAKTYPFLPKLWGTRVKNNESLHLFVTLMHRLPHLVYFRTKLNWREPSNQMLIEASCVDLALLADMVGWNKVLLPRPGCGHGELDWEKDVKHILEKNLDDRFEVITWN